MDPNEALRLFRECNASDFEAACEHASNLVDWMQRGGFEPRWAYANEKEIVESFAYRVNFD